MGPYRLFEASVGPRAVYSYLIDFLPWHIVYVRLWPDRTGGSGNSCQATDESLEGLSSIR